MSRKHRKQRPTFRQIVEASPLIQRNLFMAAVCFGLTALCFLGLLVYGIILYLGNH